jgi:hypothetical protein
VEEVMATQPKPKPKPAPPTPGDPDDDDDAAVDPEATEGQPPGLSLLDRVENLEHRMDAIEERVKAPPIGLGRRA